MAILTGTSRADTISGASSGDPIFGSAGDDTLNGLPATTDPDLT